MGLLDQISTDLSTFVDSDDFATSATYTPSGGVASTINVIFDDEFHELNAETNSVETSSPQAWVVDSDVSGVAHGDTLVISSTTYYVRGVHPDGTGITLLILSKA